MFISLAYDDLNPDWQKWRHLFLQSLTRPTKRSKRRRSWVEKLILMADLKSANWIIITLLHVTFLHLSSFTVHNCQQKLDLYRLRLGLNVPEITFFKHGMTWCFIFRTTRRYFSTERSAPYVVADTADGQVEKGLSASFGNVSCQTGSGFSNRHFKCRQLFGGMLKIR